MKYDRIKEGATVGEVYSPAMAIVDEDDAQEYLAVLVEYVMRVQGISQEEAVAQERSNLAYYAGYFNSDVRQRVERLFSAAHPVFGAVAQYGSPTPDEAMTAGKHYAETGEMDWYKKYKLAARVLDDGRQLDHAARRALSDASRALAVARVDFWTRTQEMLEKAILDEGPHEYGVLNDARRIASRRVEDYTEEVRNHDA